MAKRQLHLYGDQSPFFTRCLTDTYHPRTAPAQSIQHTQTCHHAAAGLLSMRHAADFYAQAPPEPLQHFCDDRAPPVCVINEETQPHTCVSISFLSGIPTSHMQVLFSFITLTESALSSLRAAEPGAAAFCRVARVRSFYNRPAFKPLCSR